jgi:hypothetical protein
MREFFSNIGRHAHGIEDLFAAPLIAVSRANASLSKEQLSFIMEACFIRDKQTHRYHARTIKMVMTKTVYNGFDETSGKENKQLVSFDFELPILTLLSLSTLCVKDIKTKFDVEILSYNKEEKAKKNQERASLKTKQVLKGVINHSSKSKSKRTSRKKSSIDVEISGSELPLPNGLKILLDVYSKNIVTTHKNQ